MLIMNLKNPGLFFVPENQWVAFFATHKKEFENGDFMVVAEKH